MLSTRIFSTIWICSGLLVTTFCSGAESPRAARSVHLAYPTPESVLFYNEMVILKSVNGSYFMACGWNTGYFGLQQLSSDTNKVAIFSVWDPTRGNDPKAVKTEDRVENLFAGDGVRIKRFGGEGTGGQSMMPFAWKIGETNRFAIQAEVLDEKTSYTAWLFDPGAGSWKRLATFRTRTGGKGLKGLYSFVEDFRRDGRSAGEVRRARFGPAWARTQAGQWTALRHARFTASSAKWESKENINAGVESGSFFLQTGGDTVRELDLNGPIEVQSPWKEPLLPFLK
jgi:hypothetical protein